MGDNEWSDMELDEDTCQLLDETTSAYLEHRVTQINAGDPQSIQTVQVSHRGESLHQLAQRIHTERLDRCLKANGMKRQPVAADGNCFFRAASFHLDTDEVSLRDALCQHMEDNVHFYMNFLSTDLNLTNGADRQEQAKSSIQDMRYSGVWNNEANDLMPMALANMTGRRIKIFQSKKNQAILNITPSLSKGADFKPIYLAFISVPNSEHYDGCIAIKQNIHALFGMSKESLNLTESRPHRENEPASQQLAEGFPHTTQSSVVVAAADEGGQYTALSPITSTQRRQPSSHPPPSLSPPSLPIPSASTAPPLPTTPFSSPSATTLSQSFMADDYPQCCLSPGPSVERITIYTTPQKKTPPKKRKAQPETWKKNCRKSLKLQGKEYVTSKGKTARQRQVQVVSCQCQLKCSNNVTMEERQAIFSTFYGLNSYERQKDFICRHIEQKETRTYLDDKKQPVQNKRKFFRKFFVTTNNERLEVCKKFFLATLDVGQGYVAHALQNIQDGTFVGYDKRGRHTPTNKTPDDAKSRVKRHIESFPALESHYCRRGSRRKFLDSTLNVNRMYSLYCDTCKEEGTQPVSSSLYREIFNTQYNLAFHKPKKDQCLICARYLEEKRAKELTAEAEEEYQEHQARKRESREEKEKDKQMAQERQDTHTVTFDLEAVLPTPCSLVSQVHYKRKLAVYNLTFFSLSNKDASCFVWNETDGSKGSCEIATCLFRYIRSLPSSVTHVILYSDTCSGQNRNQYVATALFHAVNTSKHLTTIDQKFLESGHSHMECDSIHATIERAKRNATIYIPDQWHSIIQMARPSSPYSVIPLEYLDFLDFKTFAKNSMPNFKTDTTGTRINWLKIKWLRFRKDDTILFKYRMTEEFRSLKPRLTSRRRGRQKTPTTELSPLYSSRLPLSEAKKKDLTDLCQLRVIPERHHAFFNGLPSSNSALDRLPEPDVTEPDDAESEEEWA